MGGEGTGQGDRGCVPRGWTRTDRVAARRQLRGQGITAARPHDPRIDPRCPTTFHAHVGTLPPAEPRAWNCLASRQRRTGRWPSLALALRGSRSLGRHRARRPCPERARKGGPRPLFAPLDDPSGSTRLYRCSQRMCLRMARRFRCQPRDDMLVESPSWYVPATLRPSGESAPVAGPAA